MNLLSISKCYELSLEQQEIKQVYMLCAVSFSLYSYVEVLVKGQKPNLGQATTDNFGQVWSKTTMASTL